MICPNCGNDIPDGLLLCEKCGTEIKIVPDFEIDVENSINETLSGIIEEIEPTKVKEKEAPKSKEEKLEDEFFGEGKLPIKGNLKPRHVFVLVCGSIILAVCLLTAVVLIVHRNSYIYQIAASEKDIEAGDYEGAILHIDRANQINPHKKEIDAKYAKVYIGLNRGSEAEELLLKDIYGGGLNKEELTEFYQILVDYYLSQFDSEKLSSLFDTCQDESLKESFLRYMALPPEFSIPTGSYDKIVDLTLTANSTGAIYYTLDGSDPSVDNGTLYTRPISLGGGEYDFKAVFVNDFGIASEISTCYYLVDSEKPEPPIVSPDSGDYNKLVTISISSLPGCEVYYTVDGTDPAIETALKYESPIKVPVGHYNYCFVTVSETGVYSDVVKRSYNVNLTTKYTSTMASYALLAKLMELGVIVDASGKSTQEAGVYSYEYDSIIEINGSEYYYKFDEFLTADDGSISDTGFYAVDVDKNVPYRLLPSEAGDWTLVPLG